MTRQEAVEVATLAKAKWGGGSSEYWLVIALEALGVLKIDEPRELPQKLRDFVSDARLAQGGAMERLGNLQHVLADCGLKIVEDDTRSSRDNSEARQND